jgi:co-chaperonin GroES (HSP10)
MKTVNFKPSPGLIMLEVLEIKAKSNYGKTEIILPEASKGRADNYHQIEEIFDEWPMQAKVVAIGEALPSIPVDVSVGDLVYLNRTPTPKEGVLVEKKLYAMMRTSDILGRVVNPQNQ